MKIAVITFFVACAAVLIPRASLSQELQAESDESALSARIEVDAHEHSFTVRFYLKNHAEEDVSVEIGRGSSGMTVVPRFRVDDMTITPPTYHRPGRRSGNPDLRNIPPGKEILYGTFTMGYPPSERERDDQITAYITFRELKATIQTEPQPLKIPAWNFPE